jgi:MerR family transcriptional regulator, light-induced transcriptional regulator
MGPRSADAAIVGAILPMARALDLAVVAEGVETESKGAHLYALGCRQAQGFLFGRPGPMSEVAPRVRASRRRRSARVEHPELRRHQSRFRAALAAGDAEQASAAVRDALGTGFGGVAVQSEVIGPALHHIGDEWELGRIGAADEHLATAIAERALAMVFDAMGPDAPERRGRVLLAAVEGEDHVLGLRMTADALRAGGHDVVYLGADVPEESLLTAVDRHAPQTVCLTATLPAGGRALVATARRLRSRHPGLHVLAGGPGVPVNALQRSGIEVADSPEHAVDLIGRAQPAGAGQIRISRLTAATG